MLYDGFAVLSYEEARRMSIRFLGRQEDYEEPPEKRLECLRFRILCKKEEWDCRLQFLVENYSKDPEFIQDIKLMKEFAEDCEDLLKYER